MGDAFTPACVNPIPVAPPGGSRLRQQPLLPSFHSHPNGSSELEVGPTAASGNFLPVPSKILHARTSRACQLPLLCEPNGMLSMGGRLRGAIQGNHGQVGEDCEGPNWTGEGGVSYNCSPSLAAFGGDGVFLSAPYSGTAKVRFIFGRAYLLIRKMTCWDAEARRELYMPYSGGGLFWSWSQGTERQVPIQSRNG